MVEQKTWQRLQDLSAFDKNQDTEKGFIGEVQMPRNEYRN